MVKQCTHADGGRLSAAKLHRHQRVQKMLHRRDARCVESSSTTSSDDLSIFSDSHSTSSSDCFISKQQRRKLRNRQSAAASRLKKKQDSEAFQLKIAELERENKLLRSLLLEKYSDINSLVQECRKLDSNGSNVVPNDISSIVSKVAAVCNTNECAIHF
jgi:hypothetical protein